MTIKLCRACSTTLINKRNHATTCSSKCRNVVWRQSKIKMISERIMFSIANHAFITKSADAAGVTFNNFVIDRAVQSECAQ